jgi:hypothetical protein
MLNILGFIIFLLSIYVAFVNQENAENRYKIMSLEHKVKELSNRK